MGKLITLSVSIFILLFHILAEAEIYKYIDENGRTTFVDREDKIPPEYREEKIKIEEKEYYIPIRDDSVKNHKKWSSDKEFKNKKKTKIEIKNNAIFIPVDVYIGRSKVALLLILDTGAHKTLLHEQSISELDIRNFEVAFSKGATGSTFAAKVIKVSKLIVGGIVEKNITVQVLPYRDSNAKYDGLLGMDFLSKHKYEIDYERQEIIWD